MADLKQGDETRMIRVHDVTNDAVHNAVMLAVGTDGKPG